MPSKTGGGAWKLPRLSICSWIITRWTPKKNTARAYGSLLGKFRDHFLERELDSISSEEVLYFLASLNDTCKQLTKHTRYAYLKALFNFIRNNLDAQLQNPCDTPMLKKLFRPGKLSPWQIHEKEVIDEIIFRTTKCETVSCWSSWPEVAWGSVRFWNLLPRMWMIKSSPSGNPRAGEARK